MTHVVIDGRAHEISAEFDERRCGWWFRMPSVGIEFLAGYTSASEDPDDLGGPTFLEAEVDCAAAGYDAHISIALGRSGEDSGSRSTSSPLSTRSASSCRRVAYQRA